MTAGYGGKQEAGDNQSSVPYSAFVICVFQSVPTIVELIDSVQIRAHGYRRTKTRTVLLIFAWCNPQHSRVIKRYLWRSAAD